ncbi:ATP-binding protein [Actinophytocola xinjiangensis]|uniref:ATP-binding protein n=1 Tax=Actinophytocola xinjiangensis TaxID=485602 RepID=A0A7Z0WMU3_9PSEU|nr:DUF2075 domain-containing protein [Actinophytocola xinjiangensis]OLF11157.1 ATP-binding protein [Actinophytocola xinjiangensis]
MNRSGSLTQHLATQFRFTYGRQPGDSEQRSWAASLPALAQDLVDADLGEVEMLVEYQLPLTSLRADVVLAGRHPVSQAVSYVVVELKQWSGASVIDGDPQLCEPAGPPGRVTLNPIAQVRRYSEFLVDFVRSLQDISDAVAGVAYLHNADEARVSSLHELPADLHGQLFTASTRGALLSFLRSRIAPYPPAADQLLSSRLGPSKQLMALAAEEIKNRESFVLLDDQQVAYRLVLNAVRRSARADHKEVIVIVGGPGSGKSVIALSVLGELYRNGFKALHATGSKSFTTTLRKVAGKGTTRVQKLFQYFNSFMNVGRNDLDALVCDEAHRIRETSNNRYTPAAKRSTKPQVEELIDASRVPVFLLDEHQVVRPGELGTVAQIEAMATAKNLSVRHVNLDGQFRCGGSRKYEEWVLRLLGLDGEAEPVAWETDGRFELRVVDSPTELEAFLRSKADQDYKARMTAGFCWPWSDPDPQRGLLDDVVIGDWRRPWNVKGDRGVNGAPPSQLWATDPAGFDQIGCIYTAQGFEYDWNGVIFGPDLVWRGNGWVADRTTSEDSVVARAEQSDYDRLIRNTYKVLLTRGMVGTALYSTDPETREKLRELVGN